MNNKIPKDSVLKKKGFYAALYSCVGIMLVIAAVMSFNNYSQAKKLQQRSELELSQLDDVSMNKDRSYLTPSDRGASQDSAQKSTATPAPSASPAPEARQSGGLNQTAPAETQKPIETQKPAETKTPTRSQKPSVSSSAPAASTQTQSEATPVQPAENPAVIIEPIAPQNNNMGLSEETQSSPLTVDDSYLAADPVETKPVFNEFAEGKYMKWPLIGEVVMDFSSDKMVYDKTLDQYRTNYSICIASELGTQVRAATDGVVKSITKSPEKGNSITIDNGNGWHTVYSQLQDGILVSEGDVVKEGQVIGGVSSPSIYGVLLGNHLEFEVMKDGTPVDPKNILSNN